MNEYELTYTVTIIVEATDEYDARDKAEEMLNEISFDYTLDDIRS